MAEPFLSEIRIMSFGYAPKGWAQCNGQLLPINQNQALFSLLGTTYGGDGRTTFALPDLRSRIPLHVGNSHGLGESGGEQYHTLTIPEMPEHAHPVMATGSAAETNNGASAFLASVNNAYTASPANLVTMAAEEVGTAGGSQPHSNMQPFLALNFCIALQGVFPPRN
ncbi:MAG: phage tail protein [Gammaproteobacteria bacterium]